MYISVQIILLIFGFTNYYAFADLDIHTILTFMEKNNKTTTNVRVLFKNNNINDILKELQSRRSANPSAFDSRDEKESEFYKMFKAHADETQKETIDELKGYLSKRDAKENKVTFNQMWTLNQLFVWNADKDVIEKLATIKYVSDIIKDEVEVWLPLKDTDVSRQPQPRNRNLPLPWNLDATDVRKAWDQGFKGQGAVVGIIDTGVRADHDVLHENWRKDHGWFDPYDFTDAPVFDNFHGTHIAGIAVGREGKNIYSAGNDSKDDYISASGTSQAAAHLSGVAALFVSQFPKKYPDIFKEALKKAAKPLKPSPDPDKVCGGIKETTYPNNRAGHGLVNVAELMKQLKIKGSKRSGSNGIAFSNSNQSFIYFILSLYSIIVKLVLQNCSFVHH